MSLNDILEAADQLSLEEQATLVDLLKRRINERQSDRLEAEALNLPEESRIRLFESLLRSFEQTADLDEGVARVWAEEAERRARAMEDGSEPDIPAEEVFARVRSSLR
jgi:putative addiction module component (TIGR02574 family)